MLPRRPIMFLKRSDMLGKASLHWRKTCKILLGVQMLDIDIQRPPCHSCPRSAHYWQESHLSHSTWLTRLCPSPRRRILNRFLIFSALEEETKYTSSQSSISSLSLIIRDFFYFYPLFCVFRSEELNFSCILTVYLSPTLFLVIWFAARSIFLLNPITTPFVIIRRCYVGMSEYKKFLF